jgi:hypothetical protein
MLVISASAPEGKATTGVPQASASIATSELVSGTGWARRQRGGEQPAFTRRADRTDPAPLLSSFGDLLAEVPFVRLVTGRPK